MLVNHSGRLLRNPLSTSRLLCVLNRSFDRDSNELAARPHAHFVEQLLQGSLDGALRNADLVSHFLVGETFEDTP